MVRKIIFIVITCISFVRGIISPNMVANLGEAPFFADIRNDLTYCAGTLYLKDIVLTAGHCMSKNMSDHTTLRITFGTNDLDNVGNTTQTRKVIHKLVHKNFSLDENGIQSHYDIALLLLDSPVQVTDFVKPIALDAPNLNLPVDIYGFGSIDPNDQINSKLLRTRKVNIIDELSCYYLHKKTIYGTRRQCYEICTSIGGCWGDSGGPLVQELNKEKKLVGIMSWGADDKESCNTPPVMYLKVADYIDWILSGVNEIRRAGIRAVTNSTHYSNDKVSKVKKPALHSNGK